MRIVKLKEFLTQPEGTLYKRFRGNDFSSSLEVFQGRTGKGKDFCYKVIDTEVESNDCKEHYDILRDSTETGNSFKLDFYCGSRDGYYSEEDDYFALYETEDLQGLLEVITDSYVKMKNISDKKS